MSTKLVPDKFGLFRRVEDSELPEISRVLKEQLPRSRRILDSINITLKGFQSSSPIYVPETETGSYSGIVVSLFAEYDDPTTAISFTSSEEDAEKVRDLIGNDFFVQRVCARVSKPSPALLTFSGSLGIFYIYGRIGQFGKDMQKNLFIACLT